MMAIVDSCLSHRIKAEQLRRQNKQPMNDQGSRDLLQYLLQADDPKGGPGFTALELRGGTELLLSAGGDTTSAVMAAIFFYLTRNKLPHMKLTQEILQTFSALDEIFTGSRLSSCRYLKAVIEEAMRISPPGVSEGIQEVLPGGVNVQGRVIREGLNIGTALYALRHHQNVFGDPYLFCPERWIVSDNVSAESVD